jgi:glycogen operon protein
LLTQSRFLHGEEAAGAKDVTWLRADGQEMTTADWTNGINRSVCVILRGRHAKPLLLFLNAYHEGVAFSIPPSPAGAWRLIVDTERGLIEPRGINITPGEELIVSGRSLLLYEGARS